MAEVRGGAHLEQQGAAGNGFRRLGGAQSRDFEDEAAAALGCGPFDSLDETVGAVVSAGLQRLVQAFVAHFLLDGKSKSKSL